MNTNSLKLNLAPKTLVHCDNCEWCGFAANLEEISDIQHRVIPGEEVPAGECPECNALAYLVRP